MEHDFFDMYLEEMRGITPLDRDEMVSVLEGIARGGPAAAWWRAAWGKCWRW